MVSGALARASFADRKRPRPPPFNKSPRLQDQYARQLRRVAREIGRIVDGFPPGDPAALPKLENTLQRYADILDPWAHETAQRLWREIDHQDFVAWSRHSQTMERALVEEIAKTPTGALMKQYLADQVKLIRSLPIQAARRVHKLTLRGIEEATRATEIAEEIMKTGYVTESRAMLIARTEVSRTATALVEARSVYVGGEFFIWRTSRDGTVRKLHRDLEGKVFRWDAPPIADERTGIRALPGSIWNCRCWAEPILADVLE